MSTSADRTHYRALVAEIAAKAKEKLPAAVNGRVESAVKLVLQGDVLFLDDGTIQVGSSDPTRYYRLVGPTCTCTDFTQERAPEGWCKHRIAAGIQKRIQDLLPQAPPVESAPVESPSVPPSLAEPPVGIAPHHIVMIQNKPFVKFAGLLQLAHDRGLVSLSADWTYNDADLSLAHAVALFADGRHFEESGDASPSNVTKKVAPHFRRCALTRASARCLRLALGVDLVAVEELAEGGSDDDPTHR
jgi:hypothetical protein